VGSSAFLTPTPFPVFRVRELEMIHQLFNSPTPTLRKSIKKEINVKPGWIGKR